MEINEILTNNFPFISDDYKKLALKKSGCQNCSIYDHYKQVVQSEGNARDPTFMFIGESPGKDELEQARPFIGRAGQRLRVELRKNKATFNKTTTLISNVIPCRPLENRFPRNGGGPWYHNPTLTKPPTPVGKSGAKEIVNYCLNSWLQQEIKLVKPKVIVTLGAQALEYVRNERGITNCRGSWLFLPQYRAWSFATYHPSYVIRCENTNDKKYVAVDFESDIAKIARSYSQIVSSDPRMSMTEEEWLHEKAVTFAIQKRILKDQPIEVA